MAPARAARPALALLVLAAATACGGRDEGPPPQPMVGKVLVVGIPGVGWEDLRHADAPAIRDLIERGATAAVSVRVSNRATEGYAALGAGQRTEAGADAAWAFNREEVVENGPAAALFKRRTGRDAAGAVFVVAIEQMRLDNRGRAFDATPGLLGERIAAHGRSAAVLGNADQSRGRLPLALPSAARMAASDTPDPGIHRAAALAAMREDGAVDLGDVGRGLLRADPEAAYGISTSQDALVEGFRRVWPSADLVVVETGDTARADAYALGLPEERSRAIRRHGLELADRLLAALLREVDGEGTLVVVVALTTPGGPRERGELRPAVVAGPGIGRGILTSASTGRAGIVTINDLTATIARHLGIAGEQFASGHPVRVIPRSGSTVEPLAERNDRAVVHDRLRAPIQIGVIGLDLVVYAAALVLLRRGTLPGWLTFLLVAGLAFPLASYVSTAGLWRLGPAPAAAAVVAATLALAGVAHRVARGDALAASMAVLAGTVAFFLADLAVGGPAQLDSVFGYTSVAGGRFFGLGNLAFAMFAASCMLLAGMSADRWGGPGRWAAAGLLAAALVWTGHPALGADVGGTLTIVPGAAVITLPLLTGKPIRPRHVILAAAGAVLAVLAFGAVDLARPAAERTHLGDFLATAAGDPGGAWEIVRRKAEIAVTLAVSTRWGIAIPGAGAVLVVLHRRSRDRWRDLVSGRPGLALGLQALIVAAVIGSVVNDTGVGVGGVMLAIGAPWALIVASTCSPPGSLRPVPDEAAVAARPAPRRGGAGDAERPGGVP